MKKIIITLILITITTVFANNCYVNNLGRIEYKNDYDITTSVQTFDGESFSITNYVSYTGELKHMFDADEEIYYRIKKVGDHYVETTVRLRVKPFTQEISSKTNIVYDADLKATWKGAVIACKSH